ncbi:MAG: hypothetical protein NTY46_07110 [Candidatus Sumerlaeota bacterium]|nr:hypothetical protein [Candidatus Sumerlaeota bacterium]
MNLRRRKTVMSRRGGSVRLGHCMCDPRNPCPCETFCAHNICPYAGEKISLRGEPAALAVAFAGCPAMMLYKEVWK